MKPSKKLKIFIILGPPGSGKGTQSKLLVKKFGLIYFGSGAALRKRFEIKDFTGKKLLEVIDKGEWAPSFAISRIWMDELEKFKKKRKFNGFVSDGSPRTMLEAQLFDEALKWYEWYKGTKVIFIDISKREAYNRLTKRRICQECGRIIPWFGKYKNFKKCDKCGGELIVRHDDEPKAINKRWKEFQEKTVPVLNYYKKQGKLTKINGEQSIEEVFQSILKTLGTK